MACGVSRYRRSASISDTVEEGSLYDRIIEAAGDNDYNADYNGAKQDGIGMTQMTIRKGGG